MWRLHFFFLTLFQDGSTRNVGQITGWSFQMRLTRSSLYSAPIAAMNSTSLRRGWPWEQVNGNILKHWQPPLICSPDKHLWLKPICAIWRSFGAIAPVNLSQRLKVDRWNRKRLSCMFFFFFLNFKANLKDFPLWIKVGRIMSNRPFFPS